MNRSSLRMKHYRPSSADFSKASYFSRISQDDGVKGSSSKNAVMLIHYKKSLQEQSDKTENYALSSLSKEVPLRTKKSSNTKNGAHRLESSKNFSSEDSWGSEDETPGECHERRSKGLRHEFESFSATDEEESKGDRDEEEDDEEEEDPEDEEAPNYRVCSSESRQISESSCNSHSFSKTKSLRDKFRESKTWSLRRSIEKEGDISPNSESRLSRLFSLRRSIGPGNPLWDSVSMTHSSPSPSTLSNQNSLKESPGSKSLNMPRLAEEEEKMMSGIPLDSSHSASSSYLSPPTMSSNPPSLTQDQLKRRHIVSSLVLSENNYVSSLQRLVNEYKVPLEESNPPIVSINKIGVLFHRVSEILQIHLLFRIALKEAIDNWDNEEKIGDVFVASFSKAVVLEIYSDFINNFNVAMECAKSESKRKSAMADFLQVKQITAADRVSFFGLMVKPVQRFPQFILILQDLLKETIPGHGDRMALQLALTTLESLAEMLNERKREAEQYAAFKEKIRNMSGKTKFLLEGDRFLLKEDDMTQLEFNNAGLISRSKSRRLLLINDYLLCVTVNSRVSEIEFNNISSTNERLALKWAVPVSDVEVIDGTAGGTLARIVSAGTISGKRSSLGRNATLSSSGIENGVAETLAQDMNDLMHDFDVVSRISGLLGSLRGRYEALHPENISSILGEIQRSIRNKDDEMSWVDSCCLQLVIKGRSFKDKPETFTFQTRDPNIKKEWVVELRLAQLALDPNNSPAWDVLESERNVSTKMPLYVRSLPVFHQSKILTEVNVGCSYTLLVLTPTRALRPQTYVWTNATDGTSSHLRIFAAHHQHFGLKELGTIHLNVTVKSLSFVPGLYGGLPGTLEDPLKADLVWVATGNKNLILYSANEPDRGIEVGRTSLDSDIICTTYHSDAVWVGLSNGRLLMFKRGGCSGLWDLGNPVQIPLPIPSNDNEHPVSCILPSINGCYVSWGQFVGLIESNELIKSFKVTPRSLGNSPSNNGVPSTNECINAPVHHMAQSGVGLWISLKHSSTICLYHTETFRHLQDINIASNVCRVLAARDVHTPSRSIFVTAISASRGLLWVGTNVGIALTIPLPRLEGVPIISGRANISYHAHFGPVTFFLHLQVKILTSNYGSSSSSLFQQPDNIIHEETENENNGGGSGSSVKDSSLSSYNNSFTKQNLGKTPITAPVPKHSSPLRVSSSPTRRRKESISTNGYPLPSSSSSSISRRTSKTLPRGFSLNTASGGSSIDCDVFGLYGELLNVRDYDVDSGELSRSKTELRKSDPELSSIPYRVSTLDRRVQMKTSRPRSLDMSSWSVESRGSGLTTSSSDTGSERPSPNVSRNASFQSTSGCSSHSSHHSMSPPKSLELPKVESPKTIITLMGGRGNINWRRNLEKNKNSALLGCINNSDAFLVIWEMKL